MAGRGKSAVENPNWGLFKCHKVQKQSLISKFDDCDAIKILLVCTSVNSVLHSHHSDVSGHLSAFLVVSLALIELFCEVTSGTIGNFSLSALATGLRTWVLLTHTCKPFATSVMQLRTHLLAKFDNNE